MFEREYYPFCVFEELGYVWLCVLTLRVVLPLKHFIERLKLVPSDALVYIWMKHQCSYLVCGPKLWFAIHFSS